MNAVGKIFVLVLAIVAMFALVVAFEVLSCPYGTLIVCSCVFFNFSKLTILKPVES